LNNVPDVIMYTAYINGSMTANVYNSSGQHHQINCYDDEWEVDYTDQTTSNNDHFDQTTSNKGNFCSDYYIERIDSGIKHNIVI